MSSGINSNSNELYAQRTPISPNSISGDTIVSEEDGSVCLDYETNTSSNNCNPELTVESEVEAEPSASFPSEEEGNSQEEEISLLPNPEVDFIEEYMVKFDGNKSRDTIFYGGVVPFVALPDAELSTEDSFFNEESFSFFLYFKRKF